MIRPVRLVMASLVLGMFGCAEQPPAKTPEQRVAAAEEKIADMTKYSRGEATYDELWKAQQELNAARRDLKQQESNVAAGEQAYDSATSYPMTYPQSYQRTY